MYNTNYHHAKVIAYWLPVIIRITDVHTIITDFEYVTETGKNKNIIFAAKQAYRVKRMNYLEIAGTLIGLLYLWFEYRVSIWLWPVGVVMPAIYIFVYYQAGLYADSGISLYYLIAGIYGWIVWMKHTEQKKERIIRQTPVGQILPLALVFVASFFLIGKILVEFTDSTVPWLDSFTTALSFIAMWMLAHKYLEQWLVWIVVDVVSSGLYIYKELYFTSALYGLYALIAIFGYLKWKQLMKPIEING